MNNDINIYNQSEVGALWRKEDFENIQVFGKLDVEQVRNLIQKADKMGNSKINIIAFKNKRKEKPNAPDFIIVESKFNK